MPIRDIYLKIEIIAEYSPVEPDDHVSPPIQYRRDCMRNAGHENGAIPGDEVNARRLTALVYREYLDPQYVLPKPDKLIAADVNEPAFSHRVPGAVLYARPGEWLRIHVKNADREPHSFHIHGLRYGIDSDGSWPFGTQASDGRRSDEICPGQTWTYTYEVTEDTIGAWPFHDHCRQIGAAVNRGLFGGLIVLPDDECERLPTFPYPPKFVEHALKEVEKSHRRPGHRDEEVGKAADVSDAPKGRARKGASKAASKAAATTPHPMFVADVTARAMPMNAPMPVNMPMPMNAPMPMNVGMRMPGVMPPLVQPSPDVAPYLTTIDELAHAPQPLPHKDDLLHVPLFFHQMSGFRESPVFQSAPLNAGGVYSSPVFSVTGTYSYICGIHGAAMTGTVNVVVGGPSSAVVNIVDFAFNPPSVTVGVGGQVTWTNSGPSPHSVVERGGDSMASFCYNGRSFVGNTPTIVAHAGQRIRWYVFDLDLGMTWHNFHTHGQRWNFAGQVVDVRSIGPAESFIVETEAPPVLLMPPGYEQCHEPHRGAKPFTLRGDFLVHCHVEMHMMAGLVALLRSHQTVYLTAAQKHGLETTVGLPLDPGDNACPAVDLNRCANSVGGQIHDVPGLPEITFMHAVLLPKTNRLLYWGYGPRNDQTRLWDQDTGLYTQPVNQPASLAADQNIWSGAHAHLPDVAGTIMLHGGYHFNADPPLTPTTEKRAFLFDPATSTFTAAANLHTGRFYPTTITMPDGKAMTLFGQDNASSGAPTAASSETFTPGGAGAWSAPRALPFNYFYYPWTFLLPGGDLFIAGPQKPARRFNPSVNPVVDNPALQYPQLANPQRGVNMDGTAVLLPLKPPNYEPRIVVAGGTSNGAAWTSGEMGALQSAEWIDLSSPAPVWQALPNMNVARDKLNSVLLPDGRVLIVGGFETPPDGGPIEIFDPMDPSSGFQVGPNLHYGRGYHSAAILMPDGSVIIGGDPNGGSTPNERYLPSYFFKPRPSITSSPASVAHGATFAVQTTVPGSIAEVVLMSAGAVTHAFNHNQRSIACTITATTATTVTATAPPDGTIAPPGYYLLFVVDHDRIPSQAAWIRLT
jgi:FtsP/CotA-like multicopper oxidase with cupredoxin domain